MNTTQSGYDMKMLRLRVQEGPNKNITNAVLCPIKDNVKKRTNQKTIDVCMGCEYCLKILAIGVICSFSHTHETKKS